MDRRGGLEISILTLQNEPKRTILVPCDRGGCRSCVRPIAFGVHKLATN